MSDDKADLDDQRLAEINQRLDKLQAQRDEKNQVSRSTFPEGTTAIVGRVATELVAGIVVGTFVGWTIDKWLETSPLFLLVLFFMGAIAGMLNVWRVVTGRGLATGYFEEHKSSSDRDK